MHFLINDITPAAMAPFPGHAPADEASAILAALHDARRFWVDPDAQIGRAHV